MGGGFILEPLYYWGMLLVEGWDHSESVTGVTVTCMPITHMGIVITD